MPAKTNANIRQKSCTMISSSTIHNSFNNEKKNGSLLNEKVVSISGNGEVDIIATGEEVFGRLTQVYDDGFCVVCDEGWNDLPTDGTAITYGSGLVGGATAGTVKTGASATCRAISDAGTGKVRTKLF